MQKLRRFGGAAQVGRVSGNGRGRRWNKNYTGFTASLVNRQAGYQNELAADLYLDEAVTALTPVQQTYSSSYSIKNAVQQTYSSAYSLLNSTQQIYSSSYSLLNTVSQTYESSFSIAAGLTSVQQTYSSGFSILNAVSQTYGSSYSVLNAVQGTYSSGYSIRNAVSQVYSSAYSIRNAVTQSYSSSYSILNRVQQVFSSEFSIAAELTAVQATYESSYSIAGSNQDIGGGGGSGSSGEKRIIDKQFPWQRAKELAIKKIESQLKGKARERERLLVSIAAKESQSSKPEEQREARVQELYLQWVSLQLSYGITQWPIDQYDVFLIQMEQFLVRQEQEEEEIVAAMLLEMA